MAEDNLRSVLVLTDTPDLYGSDLNHKDHPTVYLKEVAALLTRLDRGGVAGLVLEVPKVMKSNCMDRDRLFSYGGTYPVLRTRPDVRRGFVNYLDPRNHFFENITTSVGKRKRNYKRVPVELPCQISCENDPSMAQTFDATIHDISPGGCFIKVNAHVENEQFLNVRIPSLGNNRPIFASVRWKQEKDTINGTVGMGLLFIDLTDDQAQKIPLLA